MSLPGTSVACEYDKANRLTKLSSGIRSVSLAYDKADRLKRFTLRTSSAGKAAINAPFSSMAAVGTFGEGDLSEGC